MYPSVCLTMLSACVCEGVRERLIIHESLSLDYPKVLALKLKVSIISHRSPHFCTTELKYLYNELQFHGESVRAFVNMESIIERLQLDS